MSSWLSHAADLLARVAMNRLRLAFCSRASELAIYGGLTRDAYCGRRRRSDLVPFFLEGAGIAYLVGLFADRTLGVRRSRGRERRDLLPLLFVQLLGFLRSGVLPC